MGEEYADQSPFYYFVSHSDADLIKAVQEGRRKEFEAFGFDENIPDPQDEDTFLKSKINWSKRNTGNHNIILKWHTELIRLRSKYNALKDFGKSHVQANVINQHAFALFRSTSNAEETLVCLFNFSEDAVNYSLPLNTTLTKVLDSNDEQWMYQQTTASHPQKIDESQSLLLLPLSVVVYAAK
jgi:maltooligosyltrehalose trehalohydrolase